MSQQTDSSIRTDIKRPVRPWLRGLALVLAVIMVLDIWLAAMIRVKESDEEYIGEFLELAKNTTESTTDYLTESDFRRAWRVLRHTIGKPDSFDDYDTFASIAIAQEDYEKAADYLQGCVDTAEGTDSELALQYLRKGSAEMLCGETRYSDAKQSLTSALDLDPTLANAWLLRAQLNMNDGDIEAAVHDVTQYKTYDSDGEILGGIAPLYEVVGDFRSAAECYTAALQGLNGYDVEILRSRGICYIQLSETDKAAADFVRYLSEGGTDSDGTVALLLALCRLEKGNYSKALESFDSAVRHGYNAIEEYAQQMISCAYVSSDYERVISYADSALELEEQSEGTYSKKEIAQWYMWKGLAELALDEIPSAAENFELSIGEDDSIEDIYYYAATAVMSSENYEKAAEYFSQSAERGESLEASVFYRGCCLLNLGRYDEARQDFEWITENGTDEEHISSALEILNDLNT